MIDKRHTCFMHRMVLNITDKKVHVDHINGNSIDNRKENLRVCSRSNNQANRFKKTPKTSKYKGVHWRKDSCKWRACIRVNRKLKTIGHYLNEVEAARAYDVEAKLCFGEFARINNV